MSTDRRALVRWAGPPAPRGALLCVPWSGAGAAPFRAWAPLLPEDVELYGVRLPARESRLADPFPDALTELAEELAAEAAATVPTSYLVFGHCTGGLIAFALAVELTRRGRAPLELLVSSEPAPGTRDPLEPQTREELLETLRSLGATSRAVLDNEEMFDVLRPAIEGDVRLASAYVPGPDARLHIPITLFIGSNDELLGQFDLEAWARMTTERFTVETVEGDHLFTGDGWAELGSTVARKL